MQKTVDEVQAKQRMKDIRVSKVDDLPQKYLWFRIVRRSGGKSLAWCDDCCMQPSMLGLTLQRGFVFWTAEEQKTLPRLADRCRKHDESAGHMAKVSKTSGPNSGARIIFVNLGRIMLQMIRDGHSDRSFEGIVTAQAKNIGDPRRVREILGRTSRAKRMFENCESLQFSVKRRKAPFKKILSEG